MQITPNAAMYAFLTRSFQDATFYEPKDAVDNVNTGSKPRNAKLMNMFLGFHIPDRDITRSMERKIMWRMSMTMPDFEDEWNWRPCDKK